MSGTTLHPVYSGVARSRRERFKLGRKYGKYDFGRFDQVRGSSYYLGKGSVGDMEVACNFLFTKSRWGVLTADKNPGGVVYLDLDFTEPPDCRLKGATVQLTLDDEDEDLRRHFASGRPPPRPQVPVQITEHGPQQLHGETVQVLKTTRKAFIPEINTGGFGGIGGVGKESQQQEFIKSNWRLSSQSLPNHFGRPTTMRWDINENQLERQSDHPNTFHTAFAFEHDGQPFFMQVEVSGHLESTTSDLKHQVKRKFRRFKFPAEPRAATTMVNFGGRENAYKTPLDELARSIPDQMVLANMRQVPRVRRTRTGQEPFYQVTAETEETSIEEMTGDAEDELIEQSYITNRLTAPEAEELRAGAMAVLSLGQPPTRNILQTQRSRQPFSPAGVDQPDTRNDTELPTRTLTDADSAIELERETASQQDNSSNPPASAEQIERLLQEAKLPLVLQLIILWLMSLGTKWPQLEQRRLLPSATAAD
ncbi:hypothetical protein PG996_009235 [Apiospora saccharicola]|uniref:Uncharacterized protein n=1 Tax=Apiospora saccharicola TaxID=335842 RepID=A0ABR1UK59_9PEZI